MILTVGMAVDANVLIFERIREELRLGKPPRAAIEGGYAKALVTILDANVTTFFVALVLFQFGTGPIRGFAATLSIGIVASLITAIFITRVVFDYLYIHRRWKKVSI
jgi:preprotein translocase subunit SecD